MSHQVYKTIKALGATAVFLVAGTVSAAPTVVDFTSQEWVDAVAAGGSTATVDGVTIESLGTSQSLSSNTNSRERGGCAAGQDFHALVCAGDGIGIGDDEITEGGTESLLLSFDRLMDIFNIDFLDLFAGEQSGETAIIFNTVSGAQPFHASSTALAAKNNGALQANIDSGFVSTDYSVSGVNSITFSSTDDGFSDYALARIAFSETPSVPEIDGAQGALVFAFMASMLAIRRERKLKVLKK